MSQGNRVSTFPGPESGVKRWITAVLRRAHYGAVAFLALMMTLTVVHVVGRYAFNSPVPGFIELSSFMLLIAIFFAGAHTMVVKGHIDIGMLTERFPERTQAIIGSVTYFLCLMFTILAAWQSFVRGTYLMSPALTTSILKIPISPFMYIIGIGWALLGLAILTQLIDFVIRAVKK